MPIKFDKNSSIITLSTKNSLYAMQILHGKFLVHLYYGAAQNNPELKYESRCCSFAPYFEEYGLDYSPDTSLCEFPFFGSGDFRETALKLKNQNGDSTTLFFYRSHRIFSGRLPLDGRPPLNGGLPFAEGDAQTSTLEITMADETTDCILKLYYTLFEDCGVISRYFVLENAGTAAVTIQKAMSLTLDLPSAEYEMISLYGAYNDECRFQRSPLFHGRQSVFSRRGASSHQFNPFTALCAKNADEESGDVYGFNFVYSGNFLNETEVDQNNTTRVQIGLGAENFEYTLNPGEKFISPEAVVTFSSEGIGQMSRNFHRFVRNHILPRPKFEKRPVVLNTWEACCFNIDETVMLGFAKEAADCGIDMLVMDDGWFGRRNNDNAGLGDWTANPDKFKDGLKAFVDRVKAYRLKFGIWIEPEMVNPDSDLYRAHPEWCLQCKGRESTLSRNQLVLDFSNEQVLDYIKKSFAETFDGVGIDYFKWDMNRHLSEVGSPALPPEKQGETAYRYMLGVYKLCRWFGEHFPNAMIESCSGGGGRYDLGMMKYSTQIWASDNTWPAARTKIQYSACLAYPPSVMSCHVSNPGNVCENAQELDFRFRVALNGALGYELHLPNASDAVKKTINTQIAEYRRYEGLIHNGEFYRLCDPYSTPYSAYYFADTQSDRILLTFLQNEKETPRTVILKINVASPASRYRDERSGLLFSGEELRRGLEITTSESGSLARMWYFVKQ